MISFTQKGDFLKTITDLKKLSDQPSPDQLRQFGEMGVAALREATPKDTGETASKWQYRVTKGRRTQIEWYNTHAPYGQPVAILIQYGHGTGTGGYVQGVDYVNPAMKPVFEQIASEITRRLKT